MSKPGAGRYTTYVPVEATTGDTKRYERLAKLFNKNAGDAGVIYGAAYQVDQGAAAKAVVDRATATDGNGLFPKDGKLKGTPSAINLYGDVDLSFGHPDNPALGDFKWTNAGDPANGYVPDITSPGPGKMLGTDKDKDPGITPKDVKGNYTPGVIGTGTADPSATSKDVGIAPIGNQLVMGESPKATKLGT